MEWETTKLTKYCTIPASLLIVIQCTHEDVYHIGMSVVYIRMYRGRRGSKSQTAAVSILYACYMQKRSGTSIM